MAAGQFTLKFENATDKPWYFAVYQKFPADHKISSVVWQVVKLAPQLSGSSPTVGELKWTRSYGVCIAEFDEDLHKFSTTQVVSAELGRLYKVVSVNQIPNISNEFEEENSQHIVFQNKTSHPVKALSMGFVLGGNLIAAEEDVGGQLKLSYPATSTFYVACYHKIVPGQLVNEGVAIGPIEFDFESTTNIHTIQAYKKTSGQYSLRHYKNEIEEPDCSGTHLKLTLQNATDQSWYFGIYQDFSSLGLTSVAWQVNRLPPTVTDIPSTDQLKWCMDFGVCIAHFDTDEEKYAETQFVPADLSNVYEVVSIDGVPSISPTPVMTSTKADQILLRNNTGPPAEQLTLGFTVDNKIVAIQTKLGGGQQTLYQVKTSYYIACFHNLVLGQLIDDGVVIGPVEVQYTTGKDTTTVAVLKDVAGNYQIKVI